MRFLLILSSLIISFAYAQDRPPALLVKDEKGKSAPLSVADVSVKVTVIGNIAETVMTLNFQNRTDRILEGELVFPLGADRSISSYALEVNGTMRDGVVVEKARARKIFEDIVRQEVDPGLVEWTKGHNFRTRIYPVPANGFKKVSIGYQETLTRGANGFSYRLPLDFPDQLSNFSFTIDAPQAIGWTYELKQKNYSAKQPLEISIPVKKENFAATGTDATGQQYFYLLDEALFPEIDRNPPEPARSIAVIWDASGSGEARDHEKELQLLSRIIGMHPGAKIHLSLLRHELEAAGEFVDFVSLEKTIREIRYDGGTDPSKANLASFSQELLLLITDGISTLGASTFTPAKQSLHIFHAAGSAEHDALRHLARRTGGSYHDLNDTTPGEVIQTLSNARLQLLSIEGAEESYPSVATPIPSDHMVAVSGRFTGKKPIQLTLNYGIGTEVMQRRKVTLTPGENTPRSGLVPRLWARQKLGELLADQKGNRETIVSLGKRHRLVTPYTSLLVLDRIEDYVQHKIVPPTAELREQYHRLLKGQQETLASTKDHLDQIAESWKEMVKWHGKEFSPLDHQLFYKIEEAKKSAKQARKQLGRKEKKRYQELLEVSSELVNLQKKLAVLVSVELGKRRKVLLGYAEKYRVLKARVDVDSKLIQPADLGEASSDSDDEFLNSPDVMVPSIPLAPRRSVRNIVTAGLRSGAAAVDRVMLTPMLEVPSAKIKLTKWDPKTPYLKALKNAPKSKQEEIYFIWKSKNLKSSAFYLDVSDFFAGQGQEKLALRILTNIAELDLESIPLMRILGRRLHQLGEYECAMVLFEEVFDLRPDEPQSRRDLAATLISLKQYHKAADQYWEIIRTPADSRFDGIQLISLVELNALIARHGLNTRKYDKRLIRNLDCDARIVLTWDSNDTDMDLWITDVLDERCYYSHSLTASGGRMSDDFTDGYGPEEFLIKNSLHGKYRIEANYFGTRQQTLAGATTIQATVYTNWGRKNQKEKNITLRLKDKSEVVFIGEVEFR